MTVWVFGSSYAAHYNILGQWMQQVSHNLDTDLQVYAAKGSSIEYSYYNFNNVRSNIKENDTVIVALTTNSKRWFFKDYPEHHASPMPDADYKNPKVIYDTTGLPEVDEACALYEDCLSNIDVFNTYLTNFLYNLQYLTKQKNLNSIILISYWDTEYFLQNIINDLPLLHFPKGKLLDISIDEYSKEYILQHDFSYADKKINHLTKSNHTVLANKITDFVNNKKSIDLTQGFVKHLITSKSIKDTDFIKEELFNYGA